MDAFLTSAVLSAAVTALLLIATVSYPNQTIKFGDFLQINLTVFIVISVSIIVLIIVLNVALIASTFHPPSSFIYTWGEFLTGRRTFSAILGLLFGALFVIWLRNLLKLGADQSADWGLKAEAVLLAFLFIAGGLSDQIASLASRLTEISAGSVKLAFDPLRSAPGGPGQAGGSSTPAAAPATAVGPLYFIQTLGQAIEDDIAYTKAVTDDGAGRRGEGWRPLFDNVTAPVASCADSIARTTGNDQFTDQIVETIGPFTRYLADARPTLPPSRLIWPDPDPGFSKAPASFTTAISELLTAQRDLFNYLRASRFGVLLNPGSTIVSGCQRLIELSCVSQLELQKPAAIEGNLDTLRKLLSDCDPVPTLYWREHFTEITDALLKDSRFMHQPYAVILHAAVLWRLKYYRAAAIELDDWLRSMDGVTYPQVAWHRIRVRSFLGAVIEDWMRNTTSQPSSLLDFHLENFKKTIHELNQQQGHARLVEGFGKVASAESTLFQQPPAWQVQCKLTKYETRTYFIEINHMLNFVKQAVQSLDYFEKYVATALQYRAKLLETDLSCLKDDANQFYADVLRAYGDSELRNSLRLADIPDKEAVKKALVQARASAALGIQMLAPPDTKSDAALSQRLAPSDAQEILLALRRIRELAERELKRL